MQVTKARCRVIILTEARSTRNWTRILRTNTMIAIVLRLRSNHCLASLLLRSVDLMVMMMLDILGETGTIKNGVESKTIEMIVLTAVMNKVAKVVGLEARSTGGIVL
jgi:hypothetical protein